MMIARCIIASVILLFAAYVVVMNWGCVIASSRNKRRGIMRHHSTVPIFSFVLAALAYAVYPGPNKGWIILIPLLDIANWTLLLLPVVWMRERKKK